MSRHCSLSRICVPEIDWSPGEPVQEQLVKTLRTSRRVLAVVSDTFIRNTISLLQFRLAMKEKLLDPRTKLIGEDLLEKKNSRNFSLLSVVLLHQDPSVDLMPEDIRNYVELVTHIKTDTQQLEQKLRYC